MRRKYLLVFLLPAALIVANLLVGKYGKNDVSLINFDDFGKKKVEESSCQIQDELSYYFYSHDSPLWKENNKFGLYIYAENRDFFEIAQKLVNSKNGDWGYVLIPYNVKDRDIDKWVRVFSQLSSKHLIPVIQLWDVDVNGYKEQTQEAAYFLNRFIWPIKYRYISVYNETNDSKFWYGEASPSEYAKILDFTIKTFKSVNEDFFMMNGAFNISAPSDNHHTDAFTYMSQMNHAVPGIFEKLDGWASHPYPQPNFSGSPYAKGRWSIRAYENELHYLKSSLDVQKDLPVFITETGWAHAEGEKYNPGYLPVHKISDYFETAYKEVWLKDDRVRAVMPFTIKYDPPHDHFSWVNKDNVPYLHYDIVKSIKKVSGKPPVLVKETIPLTECEK